MGWQDILKEDESFRLERKPTGPKPVSPPTSDLTPLQIENKYEYKGVQIGFSPQANKWMVMPQGEAGQVSGGGIMHQKTLMFDTEQEAKQYADKLFEGGN